MSVVQKSAFDEGPFPILFNAAVNTLKPQVGPNAINNQITIQLPQEQTFLNREAALQSLFINYSWFNITTARGNNILTLKWGAVYFSVLIPNGFYELSDLDQFIHEWMDHAIRQPQRQYVTPPGATGIASNQDMYLIADGSAPPLGSPPGTPNSAVGAHQPLIFLSLDNPAYRFTVTSYGIPSTGPPTGYTFPANYVDPGQIAGAQYYAQLLFGPNIAPSKLGVVTPPAGAILGTASVLLGMGSPGDTSYNYEPSGIVQTAGVTTLQRVASNGPFPPQIQEFSSIMVNFSLVNVPGINIGAQAIAMFSPSVPYPNQIAVAITFPVWLPIANTAPQSTLTLSLTTDDGVPLPMQDYMYSAVILIRTRPERPISEVEKRAYVDETSGGSLYPPVTGNSSQFSSAFRPKANPLLGSLFSFDKNNRKRYRKGTQDDSSDLYLE